MDENEKKWCIKALIGAGIGFGGGAIIKYLLSFILITKNQQAILTLIIPAAMILGLVIVHKMYQKEKEKNFS